MNVIGKLKKFDFCFVFFFCKIYFFSSSGNTYGRYKATFLNSSCFFQCAGKYSCGGYNSNSIYLITNRKYIFNIITFISVP